MRAQLSSAACKVGTGQLHYGGVVLDEELEQAEEHPAILAEALHRAFALSLTDAVIAVDGPALFLWGTLLALGLAAPPDLAGAAGWDLAAASAACCGRASVKPAVSAARASVALDFSR